MSCGVLVLDPQPPEARRDWAAILSPLAPSVGQVLSDMPARQSGDVVIVHGRDLPHILQRLATEARGHSFVVVVVSGGGLDPAQSSEVMYFRRMPVATRCEGLDLSFGVCIRRFVDDLCRSGRPDWRLVEPDPAVENLVALQLYLKSIAVLGHAPAAWDVMETGAKESRLGKAWAEFRQAPGADTGEWAAAGLAQFDFEGRIVAGSPDLSGVDVCRAAAAIDRVLTAWSLS